MGLKVFKPLLAGFLCRTYQRQGPRLALTGLLGFPFGDPDTPLTEQELWQSIAPFLPGDGAFDEGIPKDRGELLLVACCHAPGGVPVPSRRISVRVGTVAKTLEVFGDRVWVRERGFLRKGEPAPFITLPVDWAHAFGGPGYAPNPVGKGFADPPGEGPLPVPNIEDPLEPFSSPHDRPAPAGLGPIEILWTPRFSRTGGYRAGEIRDEPPPLPENADWALYNQAPADQWLPGFWEGGESFRLEGLQPESDLREGRLPRMILRSLVTRTAGEALLVPLHPETVWLFPEISVGVVVHRGSLPVSDGEAQEISSVLLAIEDPGEGKGMEHYIAVRDRRSDRTGRDPSRFADVPLLPARLASDPRATLLDVAVQEAPPEGDSGTQAVVAGYLERVQTELGALKERLEQASGGKEKVAEALGTATLTLSGSRRKGVSATSGEREELQIGEDAAERARKALGEAIGRIPEGVLERARIDREALLGSAFNPPEAPPKEGFSGGGPLSALKERLLLLGTVSSPSSGDPPPEGQAALRAAIERIDRAQERLERSGVAKMVMESLRPTLHHFRPPSLDPDRAARQRSRILEELQRGGHFRGATLRGADLSDLDLSGCDFSEGDLIGADLSRSNLSGARFSGSWMAHASLSGCRLDGTDFSGAALGCADLSGSRGAGPVFEKAVLSGAVFTGCDLSEGRFSGAFLLRSQFSRSRIRRSDLAGAKFMGAGPLPFPPAGLLRSPDGERLELAEADFSGCDMTGTLFLKGDFSGCDLSGAILSKATFLECTGPGCRFAGGRLHKTAFPNSTDFSRSDFRGADLSGANLRGLDLSGSDFRGATLTGCDLSGGRCRGARMSGLSAVGARFMNADLRGVDGRGGDFREAQFLKADLRAADFSYGSLYKAGFTGALRDETTRWDQALTGKTVLSRERPA